MRRSQEVSVSSGILWWGARKKRWLRSGIWSKNRYWFGSHERRRGKKDEWKECWAGYEGGNGDNFVPPYTIYRSGGVALVTRRNSRVAVTDDSKLANRIMHSTFSRVVNKRNESKSQMKQNNIRCCWLPAAGEICACTCVLYWRPRRAYNKGFALICTQLR